MLFCGFGSTTLLPCVCICFSRCARRVVHVCDGQERFQGKLDERHRSAEIRRVKVSFRGAEKAAGVFTQHAATSGGASFTGCATHSHSILPNCSACKKNKKKNGPESHAVEFASTQHTTRTLWHALSLFFAYLFLCKELDS